MITDSDGEDDVFWFNAHARLFWTTDNVRPSNRRKVLVTSFARCFFCSFSGSCFVRHLHSVLDKNAVTPIADWKRFLPFFSDKIKHYALLMARILDFLSSIYPRLRLVIDMQHTHTLQILLFDIFSERKRSGRITNDIDPITNQQQSKRKENTFYFYEFLFLLFIGFYHFIDTLKWKGKKIKRENCS